MVHGQPEEERQRPWNFRIGRRSSVRHHRHEVGGRAHRDDRGIRGPFRPPNCTNSAGGRGGGYVYLLIGAEATEQSRRRLEAFAGTDDGFAIAQMDLEIRGPGELLGTRQAGMLRFRLADLVRDFELLRQAREDAQNLVARLST
jgi:hypothetical protein